MAKYYDYASEEYVEGDPFLPLYANLIAFDRLKREAHQYAEEKRRENERRAAEDKTKNYKIVEYEGIQYIRKFLNDSLKKAQTWMDRLQLYNELFVDYLKRKSYQFDMLRAPEFYALNLYNYKKIVKYELSLREGN